MLQPRPKLQLPSSSISALFVRHTVHTHAASAQYKVSSQQCELPTGDVYENHTVYNIPKIRYVFAKKWIASAFLFM
jgi:hypothetical protein